jgi:hypothetical protein
VVRRLLSKRPQDRFSSAAEVARALQRRPLRTRRRLAVAGLAAVVLLGLLAWGYGAVGPKDDQASEAIEIKPLMVMHHVKTPDGKGAEEKGRLGEEVFGARVGDVITVTVELSKPGYCYLIGFNFNGEEQLLWPADEKGEAAPGQKPAKVARLRYPPGNIKLALEEKDDEVGGLQVYAVVASRRPLPAYQEWRNSRGTVAWRKFQEFKGVWQADPLGAYPVKAGQADRGRLWKDASGPPLAELCQALRVGGVTAVEAVAFPVRAKEGKR